MVDFNQKKRNTSLRPISKKKGKVAWRLVTSPQKSVVQLFIIVCQE